MARFIVRRALNLVLVLFAISVITFLIFYVLPGGGSTAAAKRIAGHGANAETIATVRHDYGLDEPIYVQYARLMENTVDGSLVSYVDGSNVQDAIVEGIPATASLVIGAAVLWVVFGVAFGVLSALYAGRFPDRALSLLATLGISLPVFWLGAMLLYYLTDRVPLFPAGGYVALSEDPWGWFTHLILPWITLAALFIGFYSRVLRNNILDELGADYVRTARAKGLTERRVMEQQFGQFMRQCREQVRDRVVVKPQSGRRSAQAARHRAAPLQPSRRRSCRPSSGRPDGGAPARAPRSRRTSAM